MHLLNVFGAILRIDAISMELPSIPNQSRKFSTEKLREKEFIKKKSDLLKKFKELRENVSKGKDLITAKHMKQVVINLANEQLTDNQISLLILVPNFVPTNRKYH